MKKIFPVITIVFLTVLLIIPVVGLNASEGGILSETLRGTAQFSGYETSRVESPTFISQTIATIINYILGLMGVVFAILIIYGGWEWMTAGGNEEQVTKGKKYLINSTIGLIIILSAYTITWFVTSSIARSTNQIEEYSTLINQ